MRDLPRLIAAAPIGQKFDLTIRRNGKEMSVAATITELPEDPLSPDAATPGQEDAADLGLQVSPISPVRHRGFRIPEDVKGVVVTKLTSDGPAAAQGIELGDVIVSIDQQPATTPQQAVAELKRAAATGNVLLLISRHGVPEFIGLSVNAGKSSTTSR